MATFTQKLAGAYNLVLDVWENSTDVNANTSNVGWQLKIHKISGTGSYSSYSCPWSTSIDGQGSSGSISGYNFRNYSDLVLGSGTKTIGHNSDGTKTIYCSGSWTDTGGGLVGSGSVGGNLTLSNIPRNSTFNITNWDTGSRPVENSNTLYINKSVSSYYHKLNVYVRNPNLNLVATRTGIENGYVFTFSSEELQTIYTLWTSISSQMIVFELITYTDSSMSNQIGSTSNINYTGTITNANPTFSTFEYEDSNSTIVSLTNNNQIIVKGESNLQITISNENKATGNKGATITYYKINDTAYEYANPFTQTINNYSSNNVIVYAIDSRGNSTSITKVFTTFLDYEEPNIGIPELDRTGGINEETTLAFSGTYWNGVFSNKRNIQVGDDLSGKTLYLRFPKEMSSYLINETFIEFSNGRKFKTMYTEGSGSVSLYNNTDNLEKRIYLFDPHTETIYNIDTYVMPSDTGTVTSIIDTNTAYQYMYIEDDTLPNNSISATYQYKEKSSSTYIDGTSTLDLVTTQSDTNNISLSQTIKGDLETGFDATKSFDVKVILTDSIGSYSFYGTVAVGNPAIDIYENNVCLGGVYDTTLGGRVQGNLSNCVITDKKIPIENLATYSTDEKIVGTYVDNKPIYQQTFYISDFTTTEVFYDFSSKISNVETIISANGAFNRPEIPNFWYSLDNTFIKSWYFNSNTNNFMFSTNNQYVTFRGYITLYYTKTTD